MREAGSVSGPRDMRTAPGSLTKTIGLVTPREQRPPCDASRGGRRVGRDQWTSTGWASGSGWVAPRRSSRPQITAPARKMAADHQNAVA